MEPDELNDEPLTEAEIAAAPLVEAADLKVVVPKKGKVIDGDGNCKIAVIRPCVSRGRRIRGLPPIYEARMLARHAGVFKGWPMFMDHVPPELAQTLAKHGRSVKELGGRVLETYFDPEFVQEYDEEYGYRKGGVLGLARPTPYIRALIENDPGILHTSINAWPTGGKPGTAFGQRGMLIEGIRRVPPGSVDWVVRGGAGGRVLSEDVALVVSLAESFYGSAQSMPKELADELKDLKPEGLKVFLAEHAEHLLPALEEKAPASSGGSGGAPPTTTTTPASAAALTEDDVQRMIESARRDDAESLEEREQALQDKATELLNEREEQRGLSGVAVALIESAEGIPESWKADLKRRYEMTAEGAPAPLLVEERTDEKGKSLSKRDVLTENVKAALDHTRDLLAEARGKPRVTGEGGGRRDEHEKPARRGRQHEVPLWRTRFVDMGLAESEETAIVAVGGAAPEKKGGD